MSSSLPAVPTEDAACCPERQVRDGEKLRKFTNGCIKRLYRAEIGAFHIRRYSNTIGLIGILLYADAWLVWPEARVIRHDGRLNALCVQAITKE